MLTFKGLPVLDVEPNRRVVPAPVYRRDKTRIGSPTGRFSEIDRAGQPSIQRHFSWLLDGYTEITEAIAFFEARKGRLVPFWVPTWHRDLQLVQPVIAADSSVNISNIGYQRYQFPDVARRQLAVIKVGAGIHHCCSISSVTDGADATKELISMDASVGFAATPEQIMLSFLTLVRCESDTMPLHWHSTRLAEIEFEVVELPDEVT